MPTSLMAGQGAQFNHGLHSCSLMALTFMHGGPDNVLNCPHGCGCLCIHSFVPYYDPCRVCAGPNLCHACVIMIVIIKGIHSGP